MKKVQIALVAFALWAMPGSSFAADDTAALKAQIEELKAEIAAMKAGQAPVQDVRRFDGVWEGQISRDDRNDCGAGEIKVTVKDGQVEGSRWKYGQPAPAKGVVSPDGSFEGYTNRALFVGKFTGDTFEGYWPQDKCSNQKALMRRVSAAR